MPSTNAITMAAVGALAMARMTPGARASTASPSSVGFRLPENISDAAPGLIDISTTPAVAMKIASAIGHVT